MLLEIFAFWLWRAATQPHFKSDQLALISLVW
jgi:hypothetical protein